MDRIKSDTSIVRLLEQYGIELQEKGKYHFGQWPFHDDQMPSLSVTPRKSCQSS